MPGGSKSRNFCFLPVSFSAAAAGWCSFGECSHFKGVEQAQATGTGGRLRVIFPVSFIHGRWRSKSTYVHAAILMISSSPLLSILDLTRVTVRFHYLGHFFVAVA